MCSGLLAYLSEGQWGLTKSNGGKGEAPSAKFPKAFLPCHFMWEIIMGDDVELSNRRAMTNKVQIGQSTGHA